MRVFRKAIVVLALLFGVVTGRECYAQVLDSDTSSTRTIRVFVAFCDNVHQGIVPVPAELGNGADPVHNLYWGALYGVRTVLDKNPSWKRIERVKNPRDGVLERCVYRHAQNNVCLVADAYEGSRIRTAIEEFLASAADGEDDLVVYVGHDGLMDFDVDPPVTKADTSRKQCDAIILDCLSRKYFGDKIRPAGANPLLWTSGLMAPEGYILEAALEGWVAGETTDRIRDRAARAYAKYQKCSLESARRLLVTGW